MAPKGSPREKSRTKRLAAIRIHEARATRLLYPLNTIRSRQIAAREFRAICRSDCNDRVLVLCVLVWRLVFAVVIPTHIDTAASGMVGLGATRGGDFCRIGTFQCRS